MKTLFLKGMLMGICDSIPGISGGTIAFITGIYEKLILSINQIFDLRDFKNFSKNIKKIDFPFLIILGLGIFSAILLGSRLIAYLLDNYYAYTIAFFIGLIIASSKLIYEKIKKFDYLYGITGLIIGALFAALIPMNVNVTMPYVFLGGFVAISAMFLPGISGAFILLIMGLYEYIINALHNIEITTLLTFMLGAFFGALIISRVITYLFNKYKSSTLSFLLGLVIGSIAVPIRNIAESPGNIVIIILLVLVGAGIVLLVNRIKK
jgi:putative membrane protein